LLVLGSSAGARGRHNYLLIIMAANIPVISNISLNPPALFSVLLSYTVLNQPVGNNVKSIPILPNNMVLINQMGRAIIVFSFTPLRNWNLEQSSAKPNALKSRYGKNKEKT